MNNDIHTVPLARKSNRVKKGEKREKLKGRRRFSLRDWREKRDENRK